MPPSLALVFATLHAATAEDAVYRINNCVTVRIRMSFATSSLQLFPGLLFSNWPLLKKSVSRAYPFYLKGDTIGQSSIRENKLTQLETIMLTSRNEGMFTMNLYEKEFINDVPRLSIL